MAASVIPSPGGYWCEFLGSVHDDYYCKMCSKVARALTITSCCTESYCEVCISTIKEDMNPCPGCEEEYFDIMPHKKYRKKISSLQVCCGMKEKGCGWSGSLEHLDAHLDPDTGDCEHIDIHCPLKCDKMIIKKKKDDHVAKECVNREYICPHCSFKATYQIVTVIHWPECSYYPMECPNRCGVACERDTMEDHMKICQLEEVECQFEHFGCKKQFKREKEEQHMKEEAQTHVTMMAAASIKMNKEFQARLQQIEEKVLIQDERKEKKDQQSSFEEKQRCEFEKWMHYFTGQYEEFHNKVQKKLEENIRRISKLEQIFYGHRRFTMENFSMEKEKDLVSDWKSPIMCTHIYGHKFCIGIDANGVGINKGDSVNIDLWSVRGDHDDVLTWPVTAKFTIELINHFEGGVNIVVEKTFTWAKPTAQCERIGNFHTRGFLVRHNQLPYNFYKKTCFLKDDTLQLHITDICHFNTPPQ